MRIGFAFIFVVLFSSFWAASPALAAHAKTLPQLQAAVLKSSTALEQRGPGAHCDGSEDSEVITAAYHQNPVYGPFVLTRLKRFNTLNYPVVTASSTGSRDNIRIQPLYQLILFPFHGFW